MEIKIKARVFNKIYFPLLNLSARNQIYFGGASSGKSYFLAQRTVLDVIRKSRNYLVIRNVQRTIKNSVFNEIVKAINFFQLKEFFKINRSDLVITCQNGNQILFAGLDDTEKIKSITPANGVLTDIWIEEATETRREAVKQLNKRLRGKSKYKKRMTFSFNPVVKTHWLFKEFFQNWKDNISFLSEEDLFILKTTYKDNAFLQSEDVKALENESDKYFYDVYTAGNWGILGSVIFKNWRIEDLSRLIPTFDKRRYGLDFGFAKDPAALTCSHYEKKRKRIYIFDELYERELTNDVLAERIKSLIGREPVVCDSSEPKSITELGRYGITALSAIKGKDSVLHGIQWLQQQEFIIDCRCQNTINEFNTYKWKEDKNGNVLPIPVDRDNHILDALRYAYEDEFLKSDEREVCSARTGADPRNLIGGI